MAKHQFQTEVNQLLQLIIHSLYSHKEIFLRELISNASDALDKLKLLTLTDPSYSKIAFDPKITVSLDEEKTLLTISDTGIGMDEQDLETNLGTIARSGTKNFLEQLKGKETKDINLIGQFGVGFYSSFMVADKVEVRSKKAETEKAFLWTSDGKGEYDITETEKEGHGTTITLYLNEEGKEYVQHWQTENIIKKYSDHIAYPIFLSFMDEEYDDKGKSKGKTLQENQVNTASALWRRPKPELKEQDYQDFYKTVFHDSEPPIHYFHTQAEGTLQYTTLFYIPSKAPMDMYYADYQSHLKLYIKRVFIMADNKELLPVYLRFIHGIIDAEDLPLNVSREILQHNRVLEKIKDASVKKILGEIKALMENREKYEKFFSEFGRALKEGMSADYMNRELIMDLMIFKSMKTGKFVTFAEYVSSMKPDQKKIHYITGSKELDLSKSPLLDIYRKKDLDVLIMDDDVDELVLSGMQKYKDFELASVNRADAADDLMTDEEKKRADEAKPVVEKIKAVLRDSVKDVKAGFRLADIPACITTGKDDPSQRIQRMFKAFGHANMPDVKPVLEINPDHPIIIKMSKMDDIALFEDASKLVLEQAMIAEGLKLPDPNGFALRLAKFMEKAI